MESVKLLVIEWILEVLRAVSIKFLNIKARIEVDKYAETNEEIDLRVAPKIVRQAIIHDQEVLDMRWDLCQGCEFLTEANRCTKCGCFIEVKARWAKEACPDHRWPEKI